eukprot:TRINITY_DN64453_c0_g1_i1.p1 TRINITY_DN64453_c0_g1~~TRINITY_DN64453_c0_g1_i1.p1  ORF type:complete len:260 (-),score=69.44 TRINITY_DN64453_c0_g1_i1:172-951(-)
MSTATVSEPSSCAGFQQSQASLRAEMSRLIAEHLEAEGLQKSLVDEVRAELKKALSSNLQSPDTRLLEVCRCWHQKPEAFSRRVSHTLTEVTETLRSIEASMLGHSEDIERIGKRMLGKELDQPKQKKGFEDQLQLQERIDGKLKDGQKQADLSLKQALHKKHQRQPQDQLLGQQWQQQQLHQHQQYKQQNQHQHQQQSRRPSLQNARRSSLESVSRSSSTSSLSDGRGVQKAARKEPQQQHAAAQGERDRLEEPEDWF